MPGKKVTTLGQLNCSPPRACVGARGLMPGFEFDLQLSGYGLILTASQLQATWSKLL